jgi:hypothetical protein
MKNSLMTTMNHYKKTKIEAIDVIEDWNLNFNLGNVIKYIARAPFKDNHQQDLVKALWYLAREINRNENSSVRHRDDGPKGNDWEDSMRELLSDYQSTRESFEDEAPRHDTQGGL